MKLPEDFKARMRLQLGAEYDAFVSEYEKPPLHGFRVNTLKISADELHSLFPFSLGTVDWCPTGFYCDAAARVGKHPASRAGLLYSQEPSAMVAVEELNPLPGERVLDLCAAPGGKSTHIAAKLCGEGLLLANEISAQRTAALCENLERMGVKNAVVTNMPPKNLEKHFPLFFDKILVDAPCSGEGMFRRDSEAARCWSAEHVRSCALRQLNILGSAAPMLRGGGTLVYSTCTFSCEENEEVCEKFLKSRPDFTLVSSRRIMPHTHKGEGHFAAKFVKKGNERLDRPALSEAADASLYRKFAEENLFAPPDGNFTAFGGRLYLTPENFGSLDGLKIMRAGLYLGENKKGRFEPSHALCMSLKKDGFVRTVSLSDAETDEFYSGAALTVGAGRGYCAALWNDFPVGWGKTVDGVFKNHIPKYLRG